MCHNRTFKIPHARNWYKPLDLGTRSLRINIFLFEEIFGPYVVNDLDTNTHI